MAASHTPRRRGARPCARPASARPPRWRPCCAGEACAMSSLFEAPECAATKGTPWSASAQVPCSSIREGKTFRGVCDNGFCWETCVLCPAAAGRGWCVGRAQMGATNSIPPSIPSIPATGTTLATRPATYPSLPTCSPRRTACRRVRAGQAGAGSLQAGQAGGLRPCNPCGGRPSRGLTAAPRAPRRLLRPRRAGRRTWGASATSRRWAPRWRWPRAPP